MSDEIREHITDIRVLAEQMALTAEGVPGMNLTLSKARIASVCRALIAALDASRPEERAPLLAEWISPEPTPEMIAAVSTILSPYTAKLVWGRMLKAALIPPPPMNVGGIE